MFASLTRKTMLSAAVTCLFSFSASANSPGFNETIRPILADTCFKCHGPDSAARKADLRFDQREIPIEKGLIVPGDAAASPLVQRITSADPNEHMPPLDSNLSLSQADIENLIAWINAGAEYEPHWAFIPPRKPPIPEIDAPEAWKKNPIDSFILDRLRNAGLEPSAQADREALLRRVAFDLNGLPPTVDDIATFLADTDPGAYERVVDRLLASPAFGERMTVGWLDMARYADTFGYQNDRENKVWPWRDWVIEAFNTNLPYDRFIESQLAGDLLPNATQEQILATAFNRLHRQTNEGGSVLEEWRLEYVADRVTTYATAFLGLTMQCARCHDHKFDPISQREFYSLGAFFSSIDESGMYSHYTDAVPTPKLLLLNADQREEHDKLQQTIRKKEIAYATARAMRQQCLEEWLASDPPPVAPPTPVLRARFDEIADRKTPVELANGEIAQASLLLDPIIVEGRDGGAMQFSGDNGVQFDAPRFDRYDSFTLALHLQLPRDLDRGVIAHSTRAAEDAANRGYELVVVDGKLQFSLCHFWPGDAIRVETIDAVPADEWLHVAVAYDGSSRADGVAIYVNGERQQFAIVRDNLTKTILYARFSEDGTPTIEDGSPSLILAFRDRDSGFKNGIIDGVTVYDRALTAIEMRALANCRPAWPREFPGEAAEYYFRTIDPMVREARESVHEARMAEAAFIEPKREIMVMREMARPRQVFLLERGEYDKPRDPVAPATPESVLPFPANYPPNRLGLARWTTDPENPLTARVAVNLFWQTIFGRGLVETQEDFGVQGKLPSHPELLDFLAVWFRESGWDVKALCKLLVTTETYKQDSAAAATLRELDPYNLLLARGPSHRLSGEEIRDAALAASGLLVPSIGGPSVKPYQPGNLWKEAGSIEYKADTGDGLYRRSMYTYWKRTVPPPAMLTFDGPDRESCVARRERTATPLQSLVLLNGTQFVEAARVLAESVLQGPNRGLLEAQLTEMTLRLIARNPTETELQILSGVYESQYNLYESDPEAAKAFVEVGEKPVNERLDPIPLAALTAVAQLIMNFDEFVTKT